jgi:hypothetical protein
MTIDERIKKTKAAVEKIKANSAKRDELAKLQAELKKLKGGKGK